MKVKFLLTMVSALTLTCPAFAMMGDDPMDYSPIPVAAEAPVVERFTPGRPQVVTGEELEQWLTAPEGRVTIGEREFVVTTPPTLGRGVCPHLDPGTEVIFGWQEASGMTGIFAILNGISESEGTTGSCSYTQVVPTPPGNFRTFKISRAQASDTEITALPAATPPTE